MSSSSSSSSSLQYLRPEVAQLKAKLDHFIETRVIPAESEFHQHLQQRHGTNRFTIDAVPSCVERLKQEAKELGLWNLFIPPRLLSHVPDPTLKPKIPLSYREYGILCESMVSTFFFFGFVCRTTFNSCAWGVLQRMFHVYLYVMDIVLDIRVL